MNNKTVDGVCNEIGATSLLYLDVEDLEHFPLNSYNQCFTGYIDKEIYLKDEQDAMSMLY